MSRVETEKKTAREEILFEAAAVLVGDYSDGSGLPATGRKRMTRRSRWLRCCRTSPPTAMCFYDELFGGLPGRTASA